MLSNMFTKKNFYKLFSTILCLIFVFCISSCSTTPSNIKEAFKDKKIALIFPVSTLDLVDELTFSRWSSIQEKITSALKENFQEQNIFISSSASLAEQGNKIKNFVNNNQINFLCYAPNLPTVSDEKELLSSVLDSEGAKKEYSELNKNLDYAKKNNVYITQWRYYKNNFLSDISIDLKNDEEIGRKQAEFLVDSLGLNDPNVHTKNIEIFMSNGSLFLDNELLFNGFFSVLQPYFETNKIQCCSGRFNKSTTYEEAKKTILLSKYGFEMENEIKGILKDNYVEKNIGLDGVLATDDFVARATTNVVENQGFFSSILKQANDALSFGKNEDLFPVITGFGVNKTNVSNIIKNKQSMSIFYNTNSLTKDLVDSIFKYVENKDNKDIKTKIKSEGIVITPENIKSELIDNGYITPADAGI